MNDYNNGVLPDPCLRLDYGFGEEWASVELGDGTGYVRLADYEKLESENAKLRAERDYLLINSNPTATELRRVRSAWKKDRDENAKLLELVRDMWHDIPKSESCGWDMSTNTCTGSDECIGECYYWYRMRELGIEVTDEW